MVAIALVAIFLGGLMIGRIPEYLGKKITAAENRLIVFYALLTPRSSYCCRPSRSPTPRARPTTVRRWPV
jgi:potassium-transporting ATPase potassium-binding subunit